MMNYKRTFTTGIAKIIGSLMTIAFSLVAVAYGQSCNLLPGWNPSTLADGQSRTGYQISEATYTQTCTGAVGVIRCVSGSVVNGNTFTFPACTPHTWANCTTPTTANHLQYKTLYTAGQNSYTQSCYDLSRSLQCLNGTFTGGFNPGLYTFASCVDQSRAQCTDVWTNTFKNHGQILFGYTATQPTIGQSCTTLLKSLTCTNGFWSGNSTQGQQGLFSNCTNPVPLAACQNIITGTGFLANGSVVTKYTNPLAYAVNNQTCNSLSVAVQCINGARSGNQPGLFTGCQNVSSGSCYDPHTNLWVPPFGHIYRYTANQPTLTQTCSDLRETLTCVASNRSGGNINNSPTCGNCILPRGPILPEGSSIPGYSTILWSGIGLNYTPGIAGCALFSGLLTCTNSVLQGGPNTYQYSLGQCTNASPHNCTDWAGGTINHGQSKTGYSVTSAQFPKTCDNDFSTTLTCVNGLINGNRQAYPYTFTQCADLGGLIPGIDIAIDESPGLPGQGNSGGLLIAQGSSPEISILFKNKGDTTGAFSNISAGFLQCTWNEQNLNVYKSNVISSFVVNPGTKIGVSISIKPLFTQSLGMKTITCAIDDAKAGYMDASGVNDMRSKTFEIVKADRFDLALSRSIESISQNLDAAEGAKGTQGLQNFLFNKIMNVLVPIIIVLGILIAILGFYTLMFSTDEKAVEEGTKYILYGVIGIILIMSAKFIGQNVYNILVVDNIQGSQIAVNLYNNILYPFIKFAIYLVLGAMFVLLISRVITFLFGTDEEAQKKAGTLIAWNIIAMLIIIGAKQIVEAIYGKQDAVVKDITNLGEIGSGILADKNIPILYQVINYALGITSLIILIIIIVQTVKLLMKPDDPAQIKSITTSLLYMFIGILILGAGYLIVNFAIIN